MFNRVYRFNPLLKLTPARELTDTQKERLQKATNKKDFYGIIHAPHEARFSIKTVNRQLAHLLQQLFEPQQLAKVVGEFTKGKKEEQRRFITRLVLDSVLEVQLGDEFISGAEAVNRALSATPHVTPPAQNDFEGNFIQKLSRRALEFALNSALTDPQDISLLLYNFNRVPLNRQWRQRLPDETAIAKYLNLKQDGSWPGMPQNVRALPTRFDENGQPAVSDVFWRHWRLARPSANKGTSTYKVYFSPLPQDLRDVFRLVRRAVPSSGAHAMKIGRIVAAILRPDKFIVYFTTYQQALAFAREMARSLATYDGQGTPFSYQVDPRCSIVSLGVDPPWRNGDISSWRLYITNKLALGIQGAHRNRAKKPLEYVYTYMQMMDVDSHQWCPIDENWDMQFHREKQDDRHPPQ
jgi:hypothetical protein